jgi:hypothetical protein
MRLQKHEREALRAIREVAGQYGVEARTITRGRHPRKVVLSRAGRRAVISLPSSPDDPVWAVRVAVRQARRACVAMARG